MNILVKIRICAMLLVFSGFADCRPLVNQYRHERSIDLVLDEKDKTCQTAMGRKYVYEEVHRMCVSCDSCHCYNTDPHCIKCQAYMILNCLTTDMVSTTTLQNQTPSSTSLAPNTSMATAEQSHDDVGKNIAPGIAIPAIILSLVLALALILYLKKTCKKEKALPHGHQDTQPPAEIHPMMAESETPL